MLRLLNYLFLFIMVSYKLLAIIKATKDDVKKPRRSGQALHQAMFKKYNKNILPVEKNEHNVDIRILLELVSIAEIDEKNQIMTTQVWVRHEWHDANMIWNPLHYSNITKMQLPADDFWLPDTVLYNNGDGDYQITIKTKVNVFSNGRIVWLPPAIYKSFCPIDVTYFPFDMQICEMKFGPWTYDISKVDYWLYDPEDPDQNLTNFLPNAVAMDDYSASVEWDILEITGNRSTWKYPCCPEEYVDITYRFHIRRKTLFYTVNLIIPWLLMSVLTIVTFHLPSSSSEKITLSVSILVSMNFFILVLNDIIPPTSLTVPLMSKFLLFTIILVASSMFLSIMVLTFHFRHSYTIEMPNWLYRLGLHYLPKLLFFETPLTAKKWYELPRQVKFEQRHFENEEPLAPLGTIPRPPDDEGNYSSMPPFFEQKTGCFDEYGRNVVVICENDDDVERRMLDEDDIEQVLDDVRFISQKFRDIDDLRARRAEWQALARILDRLFLYIYGATVFIGVYAIFASAPGLYDKRPALQLKL